MVAARVLFMPVGLAALVCCVAVTSLFAASGAVGLYYLWASQHLEPYKSEGHRAVVIAGVQGGLCILIVGESLYGFISLLLGLKGLIRWYLWLSWITFFLGCFATAGTALLIWVFHFGARDCTESSSGQVTCKDAQVALKVALVVVSALGLWIQSYMPTVLRLVYSRFSAQDTSYDKLDPETERQASRPIDLGYIQGAPDMSTGFDSQVDKSIKKQAIDV